MYDEVDPVEGFIFVVIAHGGAGAIIGLVPTLRLGPRHAEEGSMQMRIVISCIFILATGSLSSIAQQPLLEPVPDVPKQYWFLYEPNWPIRDDAEVSARQDLPFETISLERRGGLGPPNYTVTFDRDGSAHFDGGNSAPRKGHFKGTIELLDFGRLCFLVERLKLDRLPEDIRKRKDHGSHGWATIVRATRVGQDDPTENWEICNSGPIELWAIQMSIDAVADRIEWEPDESPNSKSN